MAENDAILMGRYQVRVRKGDWEVEVTAPEKDFVLSESDRLINLLSIPMVSVDGHATQTAREISIAQAEPEQIRTAKPQSLNEFFRQFKLQTNLEKILVLGYWCEKRLKQSSFTSDDILVRYKEAKEPAPANIRRDLSNLVSKGFLLSDGKSTEGVLTYELTNTGIKEVEAKMLNHRD